MVKTKQRVVIFGNMQMQIIVQITLQKFDLGKDDNMKIYDYDNYYVYKDGRIYNSTNKKFLNLSLMHLMSIYVNI